MPNLDDSNSVNISNGRRNEKAEGSVYTNWKVRCASTKLPPKKYQPGGFPERGMGGERGREIETDRQTKRQTDRQADREADRQRQTDRQTDRDRKDSQDEEFPDTTNFQKPLQPRRD